MIYFKEIAKTPYSETYATTENLTVRNVLTWGVLQLPLATSVRLLLYHRPREGTTPSERWLLHYCVEFRKRSNVWDKGQYLGSRFRAFEYHFIAL